MRGTVLLVEDEFSMGTLVQEYLRHEDYSVVWVRTGGEALAELARHPVVLVLLDIGLPDMDGFDVCRAIKSRADIPVIMLTARTEEADRVAGLELGADDYVTKPFSPRELMARVKVVLRRAGPAVGRTCVALADVELDVDGREVSVAGAEVELTAKEFDLLYHLVSHRGVVFTREQLLDSVWGLDYPEGTRTVDVHIAQIRRKLGRPELIQTVHGVGYKAVKA